MTDGRKESDSKELDEEYQQLMKERERDEQYLDEYSKGLVEEVNAVEKEDEEEEERVL